MTDDVNTPSPDGDNGQEPPTPDYPVRQRHQIGEPEGKEDGGLETPAK